jgi:hypothetical protein
MRHLFILTFMLAGMIVFSDGLSAQALKNEPKPGAKSDAADNKKEKDKDKDPKKFEWPTEVLGKKLDYWVKEASKSPDPSNREAALRILPQFGPDARKTAGPVLLSAMTKDTDINVRLTALATVPLLGFDDANIEAGLNAMVALLKPSNLHDRFTRMEAVSALAACGPVANRASAIPTLVEFTCKDPASWQLRKAAAAALASIGQPVMEMETPKAGKEGPAAKGKESPKAKLSHGKGPDSQAIKGLIKMLSPLNEHSHEVRRQVITSMRSLGPPHDEAGWKEYRAALQAAQKDPDQSVSLWARVAYIEASLEPIKGADLNLRFLVDSLKTSDPAKRIEIMTAIGALGDTASNQVIDEFIALATSIPKDAKPESIKGEDLMLTLTAIRAIGNMPSQMEKSMPVLDKLESTHKIDLIKEMAGFSKKLLVLRNQDREKMNLKEPKVDKPKVEK